MEKVCNGIASGRVIECIRATTADESWEVLEDAPFATMDTEFKIRVPTGLRTVVPQLVIFSSYDQWKGEVESALGPSVGSRYVLELHRPGDVDSGKTIPFGKRLVDYVVAEPRSHIDCS
jgi:hypothetical protein